MPVDFKLYLITDRNQLKGVSLTSVVEAALAGGVRAVQLREKDLSAKALFLLAVELRKLTNRYGARLFINDRIDIAQAVEADGIHLGGNSMPLHAARSIFGTNRIIGVSCHSCSEALAARNGGADFITFGPVYYTPSKAFYGDPVGLENLAETATTLDIPVFGLGGINQSNTRQVMAAGASGVALISAIIAAEKPEKEAATINAMLQSP